MAEAVETCAELKAALPKREGSPYKELHAGIIYGLLAHSHSWKGEHSQPITNVENALWTADAACVHHPRQCIDLITVSDLATWHCRKLTFLSPRHFSRNAEMQKIWGPDGSASTGYVCCAIGGDRQKEHFSPIGELLTTLFTKLAWDFRDMRRLEEYFRTVQLPGSGKGKLRHWNIDIYSPGIRDRVYRGQLSNGVSYDEWHVGF